MRKDKLTKRIIVVAIGLLFCGIGIGLTIFANLGVDPASVFQQGIAKVFGISYGTASAAMNIVLISIMFFANRKSLNIATLMAIFMIGYTADFVSTAFKSIFFEASMLARVILLVLGCAIMSLGVATYISPELGVGAVDLVSETISSRTKIAYRWVRISCDVIFLVVGYFLGGNVGVGTVVVALFTGPLVQFFRPIVYKITGFGPEVESKKGGKND